MPRMQRCRKDPNVNPQANQTGNAKTKFKRKSREHLCQTCGSTTDKESKKVPLDVWTGRSVHTCLSRSVPADHEAQNQAKDTKRAIARANALRRSLTQKKYWSTKFKIVGIGRPRAWHNETRVTNTREGKDKRSSCSSACKAKHMKQRFQSEMSDDRERHEDRWPLNCVGRTLRSRRDKYHTMVLETTEQSQIQRLSQTRRNEARLHKQQTTLL